MELPIQLTSINILTIVMVIILILSMTQGAMKGAVDSVKHLIYLLTEGVVTVVSLMGAWLAAGWLSPIIQRWLTSKEIVIPSEKLEAWQQFYFTMVTSMRDFQLFRTALCFIVAYIILSLALNVIQSMVKANLSEGKPNEQSGKPAWYSYGIGAVIGAVSGAGRALLLIAVLFVFSSLFPNSALSSYISQSQLYQLGASKVIQPVSGEWINQQLPVITQAVTKEYQNVLNRKYDIIDQHIPAEIEAAAVELTQGLHTDEAKARKLYDWVGTRIQYDFEKVRMLEEEQVWNEQSPKQTFETRKGVCIDYSRLYALMARAAGLEVEVVTGLGYDGRGSYGPHAWNEVYLSEEQQWVPLDTTWVPSGGNWFNPDDFHSTHIKDA
jgi:hypothetical protein